MSFPTTPLLDAFNRANESPLAAPWAESDYWWGAPLDLVSNAVANSNLLAPFWSGSYWTSAMYGPDFEAYVTVGATTTTLGEGFVIDCAVTGLSGAGPATVFDLNCFYNGSGAYHIYLEPWEADVLGTVIFTTNVVVNAGDRVGIRRVGQTWTCYVNGVGVVSGSSIAHYVPLTIGLAIVQTTGIQTQRLDDFGGGTIARTVTPPTILGTVSHGRAATGGASSLTIAHTVTAGTQALLVFADWDHFGGAVPVVSYAGIVMRLLNYHDPVDLLPATYLLLTPPAGGGNVVITPVSGAFNVSACGFAVNIANYGGIRYADWAYSLIAPSDPALWSPVGDIYHEPTDLILTAVATNKSGATFTALGTQSLLFAQDGFADTNLKIAAATAPATGAIFTSTNWDLTPDEKVFDNYIIAIKGLDGIPFDVPTAIGPVTNTFTTEGQPAPSGLASPPLPGAYWSWPHTVDFGHRTLTVLVTCYDPFVAFTDVSFNGIPLTRVFSGSGGVAEQWLLEDAPIGTYLVEVRQNTRRTFMGSAWSLASGGIIATASAVGVSGFLSVASQPNAIVIGQVDLYGQINATYSPVYPTNAIFVQPYLFNNETPRPHINETQDAGAGGWSIYGGATGEINWTLTPGGNSNVRIVFSFIPITPPTPPIVVGGCPNTLTVTAEDGVGCHSTLGSSAV